MSMFFGDPERKRREKQEKDSEQDYLRHKRVVDAKQAPPKRLLVVKQNKSKPLNFGSTNPQVFFNFGQKKSKGKRKKQTNFSLF